MNAIHTKYKPPAATGARYVARVEYCGSIKTASVSIDHALDNHDNHKAAALTLCKKLGWICDVAGGTLPDQSMAWVLTNWKD